MSARPGLLLALLAMGVAPQAHAASTPIDLLRNMIEHDLAGDTEARVDLAADGARTASPDGGSPDQEGAAFMLDADPLVVAVGWRFGPEKSACSAQVCTITVTFDVVGVSKGDGVPGYEYARGRELIPLQQRRQQSVRYTLVNRSGTWKISVFPIPYVSPAALLGYFEREFAYLYERPLPKGSRAALSISRQKAWRERQIASIRQMPQ